MGVSNPYGYTQQGQNTQNFMDILKTITGGAQTPMSPQAAQQGYQSALSSAIGLKLGQPAGEEQARQDLTQQSGIPGLQQQYGDLGKLFEMYLADTGLAGKYANTSNTNPYANPALTAGTPEGEAPNPYLASPEALTASATPVGGGFTDPSLTTQAMGAPVSAASNLMDLVSKAIGLQEGKVTKKMGDVSANYQAALSVLGTLADVFGTAYKDAQDREFKERELSLKYADAVTSQDEVVQAYVDQVKGGLAISSIPDEKIRNATVKALSAQGYTQERIKREIEGKTTIGVMKSVKDAWDAATGSGLPTGGPLGVLGVGKSLSGSLKFEPDVQIYERYKKGIISTLRTLVGEKGILSNQDMIRMESLLPDFTLDSGQATKNWLKVQELLEKKYGKEFVGELFTIDSSSANTSRETRVINGVTYQKVPGGWSKVQ